MSRRYRSGYLTANPPAVGTPNAGIWTADQQFSARGQGLWPAPPGAPTIGTATAGVALCASVTFTAPACKGYPASITSYQVTSTPGCKTATGSASPITVTGLTCGTSYTFKVKAQNSSGLYGACSAASNSAKAVQKTCATYTTAGTYSWVAPAGVTSVAVVAVGGGGFAGGGLAYGNNISVNPGCSYSVKVGAATQQSYFINACTLYANGGKNCGGGGGGGSGGGTARNGGGTGGNGYSGAGGAGGYSGNGGNGGNCGLPCGAAGTGGAGGGGGKANLGVPAGGGGGGGVGILGQGASGAAGGQTVGGKGGSGGTNGGNGYFVCCVGLFLGSAGSYGGGGACGSNGAVRIVWAGGSRGTPSFPSTNVGA